MKIVYLFFSFTRLAGTERILIDKMNYLAEQLGHDVTVITYEQGSHPFVYPLSEKVHHVELNTRFFTLYKYNLIRRAWLTYKMRKIFYSRFNQVVSEIKPDVVICTTYRDYEIKAVADCSKSAMRLVESHVSKDNMLLIGNERIKHSLIQKLIAFFRKKKIFKDIARCDYLIALTESDAQAWSCLIESVVIPNMVTSYPEIHLPRKCSRRAISVGRLAEGKGYDMLIDIWEEVNKVHDDWSLHIYGEGGEYEKLKHKINDKHLENSIFLEGATNDVYSKYLESDLYLMSSRYEGFGLVLVEAMSCGLPCIAFNCPCGPSDIIQEGRNGYVVPMFDKMKYVNCINILIEQEQLRNEMSRCARNSSLNYLPSVIMEKWEKFFHKAGKSESYSNKIHDIGETVLL